MRRKITVTIIAVVTMALCLFAYHEIKELQRFYERNQVRKVELAFEQALNILGTPLPLWSAIGVTEDQSSQQCSWRFALLHRIEVRPWPENLTWTHTSNRRDRLWSCPWYCYKGSTDTFMFAIKGKGTAFGEQDKPLEDAPEDLIVLVEVVNSNVHWMQPGDFDVATMPRTFESRGQAVIGSRYPDGFHVGFADAQVWRLSKDIPFEKLQCFFTKIDAETYDREELLGPYRISR